MSDAAPKATDWDSYYGRPGTFTPITRRTTERLIDRYLERAGAAGGSIIELGGANSCFYDALRRRFRPRRYAVVDYNALGLRLLRDRYPDLDSGTLETHQADLLAEGSVDAIEPADVCYSVGLIEHFDREGTAKLIERHFQCVRPGGHVLITFPTPTWLYRAIRGVAEAAGQWIFHDERPLLTGEVTATANRYGTLLESRINWLVGLTQGFVLYRKHSG